jgi:DNA-binding NarL/FixJ family response regulator
VDSESLIARDQADPSAPRDEVLDVGFPSGSDRTQAIAKGPIAVLLLDDHPAVRWGLAGLLGDQPDLDAAAVVATAEAAVARAEREEFEVAVLDYHLGGRSGLWATGRLKALPSAPRVVIFSAFASDHLAARCAIAGADALLSKGSLGDELCNAIRAVARGRTLLPQVPPHMAQAMRERLDTREQVIFGMLLAGVPVELIEERLGLSAQELAHARLSMLAKLEPLPGEVGGAWLGGSESRRAHPMPERNSA